MRVRVSTQKFWVSVYTNYKGKKVMGLVALNLSNIATFLVFKVVQAYGQVYIYYLPMYLYSEYKNP